MNEAALFAARGNKRVVSMVEFEKAKDKIMMGAERRSMVMTEAQKESTAYHERVMRLSVAWCRNTIRCTK
uniref:hypothetical protein n=1 Tax=Streptomyces flavalbus TaxID=2665155 RepID=UPI0036D3BB75